MTSSQHYNIWLQPGTRAHMLVYKPYHYAWEVWTATNSRSGASGKWLGTYMELKPDGECVQHYRSESEVTEIIVRNAAIRSIGDVRRDFTSRWLVYLTDADGTMLVESIHTTFSKAARHVNNKLGDKQWTIYEERCVARNESLNTQQENN